MTYQSWPVAVWQCCGCGSVETRTLYGGFSQYSPPSIHACRAYNFAEFVPLNHVAKSINESHAIFLAKQESIRKDRYEELKNWPPAPGYRCYWEI
jgi:hypothetical protein